MNDNDCIHSTYLLCWCSWRGKYQRGGVWWIGWRAHGQQFLESTGKTDEAEAQAELDRVEAMSAARRAAKLTRKVFESLTGASTTRPIKAEAEEWLKECTATTARGTSARYRGILDDLLSFLNATPQGPLMAEIDERQVRAYLTEKATRASVSTVNLERKILSGFFKRAVDNGAIQTNPVSLVKRFKASAEETERTERRNFTLEEISRAYVEAPNDFWRYMILAGFYSGLREGDLILLDWSKVDFQKMLLRLKARKTGKTVLVPIARRLAVELQAEHKRQGNPKAGPLWPEQAKIYKKRGASPFSRQFYKILSELELVAKRKKGEKKNGQAGRRTVNEVSFHSLRHSFVTALNASGGTNLVAKELAGHSSDLVNNLYSHLPIEMLEREIARLPEVAI